MYLMHLSFQTSQLSLVYLKCVQDTYIILQVWIFIQLTQSLFYNKMLTISCNLLNTMMKVKSSMVVNVSVVYPECVTDWELWLTAMAQHHKRFMRSKFRVQFLLNVYSFCSIVKLKNVDWTIVNQGPSVLNSWACVSVDSLSVDSTNSGWKIFGGKIPGSSKKQNLNVQHWQLFS